MNIPSLCLPVELTVFTVADTHRALLESWPNLSLVDDVLVDAAAVQEVDAAGVQLLASLRRSLADRDQVMSLVGASDALLEACRLLGCNAMVDAHLALGARA